MGKSSKKRKRAEKAAAASLVLSEQPEESAMDVEANINIIRPMDSLKPGEFKRLVLKSLDDSIAMYKSLKRQGKELPPFVPVNILSRLKETREALEKDTDGSFDYVWSLMYLKKYMKYFFTSNWKESLYKRLRINRVEDVLGSQDDMKAAQQLEYYRYLFKNEAKNITDEEKLWMDVKEKFPLLNQYVFKSITDCFYPSGKKCDQNELLGIMKEFEFIYWETMKTGFPHPCGKYYKFPLPCGKYYKVKQQLALDLGIVKYDSKGFLVDNYNLSEWKIP